MGVWVNNKCCVVCFGFCITSWFLQEFCLGCKYCSLADLGLLFELKNFAWRFWCFVICFPCTILLGVEPKHGQILGVWKQHKVLKKKKLTNEGPLPLLQRVPPSFSFHFLFSPFSRYLANIVAALEAEATAAIARSSTCCLVQEKKKWKKGIKKSVGVFIERLRPRAVVVTIATRGTWVKEPDSTSASFSSSWWWSFFSSLAKHKSQGEEQKQEGKELLALVIFMGSAYKRGRARKEEEDEKKRRRRRKKKKTKQNKVGGDH